VPPESRPLLYAVLQYVGKQTAFAGKTQTLGESPTARSEDGKMRVSDIGNPGKVVGLKHC